MKMLARAQIVLLTLTTIAAGPPPQRFLLLDTGRLLEGELDRTPDGYRVRRGDAVTEVPAARVVAVCDDRTAAFQVRRDKIDPRNADERLKLAQWCYENGMAQEAIAETKAALELRPNHVIAQRLLRFYEQAAHEKRSASMAAKRPTGPIDAPREAIECSPAALQHFRTKVQPVLMNACAGCHAEGSKFRLQRVYSDSANSRWATLQNLAAVTPHINRIQPDASPLLRKAVLAHGGSPAPPIRHRATAAFGYLESWVRMIATDGATVTSSPPLGGESPRDEKSGFAANREALTPGGPKDAFDPTDFNKKNHPEKP